MITEKVTEVAHYEDFNIFYERISNILSIYNCDSCIEFKLPLRLIELVIEEISKLKAENDSIEG